MITTTNKIYGYENENALRQHLSAITTLRGRTIKPDAFAKMMHSYRTNPTNFKIKLLNNYKIKYENVNQPIDYLVNENNTTTINNLKGNNDMKGIETLKLYNLNKKEEIRKEYDKKVTEIKLADTNYKAFVDAQDTINNLIDTKKYGKVNEISKFEKISDETKLELAKTKEKFEAKMLKQENFYNEVMARLSDTTTKDEADDILGMYGVIDADGKINK